MGNKIFVLHQYGAPEHFRALTYLYSSNGKNIYFREFTFRLKGAVKDMLFNRDFESIKKIIINKLFFGFLRWRSPITIVLALAPYDARIKWVLKNCKKHELLYFTSWVTWDGSNQPFNIQDQSVGDSWKFFLERKIQGAYFVSNAAYVNLRNNFQIRCKSAVVNHSAEKEFFFPGKSKTDIEELNLILVGSLDKRKGISKIYEIIDKLEKIGRKFNFSFVGKGEFEKEIDELSEKKHNIRYYGFVHNKQKLGEIYRENDFLILPSTKVGKWQELFGIAIIEAMSCGVVPIATTHVGPKEIIAHNKNGMLFDESVYVDSTVDFLCNLTHENYNKLKSETIKTSKEYDTENIAQRWKNILGF